MDTPEKKKKENMSGDETDYKRKAAIKRVKYKE